MTQISRSSGMGTADVRGTYFRLGMFLFIIFLNFVYLSSYRLYTYLKEDEWIAELEQEYPERFSTFDTLFQGSLCGSRR